MDRPFEAFVFGLHICMNTQDVEVVTFKMKPVPTYRGPVIPAISS